MHYHLKFFLAILVTSFTLMSYAINVKVSSASSQVYALGFSLNGKNYGSLGRNYKKSGLPAGSYLFGVRINGYFGKDIACLNTKGEEGTVLTKDADITLIYKNNHCVTQLN